MADSNYYDHLDYVYMTVFVLYRGHVAQSVTCLVADTCLTADPGVLSSFPARNDHEIISTAIVLPSTDSRRAVVSYKQKYVHEVLVNLLVKLPQEKCVVR